MSDHVVRTGEQITHWDMLNKEHSNLVALVKMSQCVQFGDLYHLIPQLQRAHSLQAMITSDCEGSRVSERELSRATLEQDLARVPGTL